MDESRASAAETVGIMSIDQKADHHIDVLDQDHRRHSLADTIDRERRIDTERHLAAVVARLRRFVSPPVADLIVHGSEEALRSRRCEVTVVFLDLRGFTKFSESVEPEDVMVVLQSYHQAVGRLVSEHHAVLERFTGDGITIFFNAPVSIPDPQRRAVQLVVAAQERVGALAREWRILGSGLALGAGISHGFATVGRIGCEDRCDYAVIGSVTNVAARLCARARAGETLVCQRVMSAVEPYVEAEALGQLRLRGFHRSHLAFRVKALKTV